MAVRIRLTRKGKKHQPTYRVVVADARAPRDGRFIEQIGRYDPRQEPSVVEIDNERANYWLSNGAQPSDQVRKLLEISGALEARPVKEPKVHVVGEEAQLQAEAEAEAAAAAAAEAGEDLDESPEEDATDDAASAEAASADDGTAEAEEVAVADEPAAEEAAETESAETDAAEGGADEAATDDAATDSGDDAEPEEGAGDDTAETSDEEDA